MFLTASEYEHMREEIWEMSHLKILDCNTCLVGRHQRYTTYLNSPLTVTHVFQVKVNLEVGYFESPGEYRSCQFPDIWLKEHEETPLDNVDMYLIFFVLLRRYGRDGKDNPRTRAQNGAKEILKNMVLKYQDSFLPALLIYLYVNCSILNINFCGKVKYPSLSYNILDRLFWITRYSKYKSNPIPVDNLENTVKDLCQIMIESLIEKINEL